MELTSEAVLSRTKLLVKTCNSEVYSDGDKVYKIMPYRMSTAREVSFLQALDGNEIIFPFEKIHLNKDSVIIEMKKAEPIKYHDLASLFRRCIQILATLEDLKIVHLDFKPDNLAMRDGVVYLRDFGNSTILSSPLRGLLPHPKITAPELLKKGGKFDTRVDLWSLGCWMFFHLKGYWPINYESDYGNLDLDDLSQHDLVGVYTKRILENVDYTKRPLASEIAKEINVEVKPGVFNLPKGEYPKLIHSDDMEDWSSWKIKTFISMNGQLLRS